MLLDLFEMHLLLFLQPFLFLNFLKEFLLSELHPFLFFGERHHHLLILGEVLRRHDTLEELERFDHVFTGWRLRGRWEGQPLPQAGLEEASPAVSFHSP